MTPFASADESTHTVSRARVVRCLTATTSNPDTLIAPLRPRSTRVTSPFPCGNTVSGLITIRTSSASPSCAQALPPSPVPFALTKKAPLPVARLRLSSQVSLLQSSVLPSRSEARARDAFRWARGHVWRARKQQFGRAVWGGHSARDHLLHGARRCGRAATRLRRLESLLVRDVPGRASRMGDGCVELRSLAWCTHAGHSFFAAAA